MSNKPEVKDAVLYIRKFPRDLKRRMKIAAVNEGTDLQQLVPLLCAAGLTALADIRARGIK